MIHIESATALSTIIMRAVLAQMTLDYPTPPTEDDLAFIGKEDWSLRQLAEYAYSKAVTLDIQFGGLAWADITTEEAATAQNTTEGEDE